VVSKRDKKLLAGIVLAAGASQRLGQPKQLCEWRGKSFVGNAVAACVEVCDGGVTVVTGATASEVEAGLTNHPVTVVRNPEWESGMAGSLRCGVTTLGQVAGALIMVCDQPLVSGADLARLAEQWRNRPGRMAASRYGQTLGVPAIFPAAMFPALLDLQGDEGARKLLRGDPDIGIVDIPSAATDIDTPADWAALQQLAAGERGD